MPVPVLKNKRLKISPGGLITLPVAARKALAMKQGESARVAVSVQSGEVVITTTPPAGARTWKISRAGMMLLRGESKALLGKGPSRHYLLKLDDAKHEARLVPQS